MKLLVDENGSRALLRPLSRVFPGSAHVTACGLERADDQAVWAYAKAYGYAILTKDADFQQVCFLYGAPPKVVWVRLGICTTRRIETLVRVRAAEIEALGADADSALLVLPRRTPPRSKYALPRLPPRCRPG